MAKPGKPSVFSQFRTAQTDDPGIVLEGNVDYAIVTLGTVILVGWLPNDAKPRTTHIRIPGTPAEAYPTSYIRHQRDDVTDQFEKIGRRAPFKAGFVCTLPLSKTLQDSVHRCLGEGTQVEIGIELDLGVERRFSATPSTAAAAMRAGVLTRLRLQMALQSLASVQRPDMWTTLQIMKSLDAPKRIHAHIDIAQTSNRRRMLLGGWIENADQGRLVLLGGDLAASPQELDPVITPREDVSTHLRSIGLNPGTNLHGFVVVADIGETGGYRICRVTDHQAHWSDDLEIEPRIETTSGMIGRIRSHVSESVGRGSDSFHRLVRSALGQEQPPPPAVAQVKQFGPAHGSRIQSSIIVPFYGDAFYLLDHLVAQVRAPSDVEWIFVCDDPRLSAQMLDGIANRKGLLRQSTKLVLLAANGGFAHANNIGAEHAQGEYLLLMNSDIYCRDFDFLAKGVATLKQDSNVGCVGFSLQFEDGTIQHDGMSFENSRWIEGLWTCEHRNKGMPQDWTGITVDDAEAVTAALLLLRRSDFVGRHIFDPAYLVGDFEDADLCMRIRDEGKRIAIVRGPGIYHLERQSLRYAGTDDARSAITHLNCMTFNDRWGDKIAKQSDRK